MKKLLNSISLTMLLMAISFLSFSQASPSQLTFGSPDAAAKTFTLSVNANASWVVSNPTWTTVDKQTGQGTAIISINVNESNPSFTDSRSERIIISATMGNQSQDYYVTINQVASTPEITVTTTTLTIDNTTSSNFTFTANTFWTVDAPAWITVIDEATDSPITYGEAGTFNLSIQAEANDGSNARIEGSTQARTGTVTFTSGSITKTITVTQAGKTTTDPTDPTDPGTGTVTGVEDLQYGASKLVTVYPNPSNGSFRIKSNDVAAVKVYTESGAEVLFIDNVAIDQTFEVTSKGLLFVEIITSTGSKKVERLIVY